MPKLPNSIIQVAAKDGAEYKRSVSVTVLIGGTFSVEIPDELYSIVVRLREDRQLMQKIGDCEISGNRDVVRLYAKCLAYPLNLLREAAKEHLAVETIVERVIVYRIMGNAAFYLGADGKPHSNGVNVHDGEWWKGKKSGVDWHERMEFYSIGLACAVYDRTTYKRNIGSTVSWKKPDEQNGSEIIRQINSFVDLALNPNEHSHETMLYTPEAGEFFLQMMLGICGAVKAMTDFFADKDVLKKAILDRASPALGWASNPSPDCPPIKK